jgi:acyl-CoA thioesterase
MSDHETNRSLRDAAAIEPVGPGRYAVEISDNYTILGKPNGGYLQCVLASAALAAASDQGSNHVHVTAITTNYSGAPSVGGAELQTAVRRIGRSVSFVHVALVQEDVVMCEALITLGSIRDGVEVRYLDVDAPQLAPLDDCLRRTIVEEIKLMQVVDFRLDPSSAVWLEGGRSTKGEVRGWLRLDDGASQWDPWSLLFASDSMPPATFPLGSSGWVPTLQLTSYVHAIPSGEWLKARQWCTIITDGRVEERAELFDSTGVLVASSSQLALVRFPAGEQ